MMKSPKLPSGTIPAGATHFYFDRKRTTSVSNPWRRLDEDGNWHMLRAYQWGPITGTKKHNFFAIADALPGGRLADEPMMASDATLLDYFAGIAMGGLQQVYRDMTDQYESASALNKCMAESAYDIAYAMLAAREVTK